MNLQRIMKWAILSLITIYSLVSDSIVLSRNVIIFNNSLLDSTIYNPDCIAVHNIGKLAVKSSYPLVFGGRIPDAIDCFNHKRVFLYGAEYPKNSGIASLYTSGMYISGILYNDTLLITNSESSIVYSKQYRSTIDPNSTNFKGAISEQDYLSRTVYNSELHMQVSKSSYAWSYEYAEDFVLFDIEIKSLEKETIKDLYIGLQIYFTVAYSPENNPNVYDDIGGFLNKYQFDEHCNHTINNLDMIWGADNDGDPVDGEFVKNRVSVGNGFVKSATSVSGAFFLDYPENNFGSKKVSYNWWSYDYAPQHKSNYRAFKGEYPSLPFYNKDYYYIMSNNEIDFDQIYTASINQFDSIWTYPDQKYAKNISDGYFLTPHMISVGPFDIPPGGVLKIPFAYVAGENFHTKPDNIDFLPDFPQSYYNNLDFSDLVKNAQWARWIYDNPGVDTDGDGDSGSYTICVLDSQFVNDTWLITATDTFWYRGDGVPDWKAAGPPPAPYV